MGNPHLPGSALSGIQQAGCSASRRQGESQVLRHALKLIAVFSVISLGAFQLPPPQNAFGVQRATSPLDKRSPWAKPSGSPKKRLSERQRLSDAIRLMDKGNAEGARAELEALLTLHPKHRTARDLLRQLDVDPKEYFGLKGHFDYMLTRGDSLWVVAERFLGDPLKLYALARYNGLVNPSRVRAGRVIEIPGEKPLPAGSGQGRQAIERPKREAKQTATEAPRTLAGLKLEPRSLSDEELEAVRVVCAGVYFSLDLGIRPRLRVPISLMSCPDFSP
ncbi:MAG: LysM peptidoglycan-binding domain-containing protein [Nitrospinota bacterium]